MSKYDLKNFTSSTYRSELDAIFESSGAGSFSEMFKDFFVNVDRFGYKPLPGNSEHSGLTFITRPRLNLTSMSLKQNRVFAPIDTTDTSGIPFAIRCLLDTKFCSDNFDLSCQSPLVNPYNPFFIPLTNSLASITGFPDPVIQTATTEGGFHGENQSFAIGSDRLGGTYDLTLNFNDIQNSPIRAIFQFWLTCIDCLTKGEMVAYPDDIDEQRLNYTVSIYRFLLDPTKRRITGYAKATGCFPKSMPLGAMFNFDDKSVFNEAGGKFSVPFVTNKIEYNDYGILLDFIRLCKRYCVSIEKLDDLEDVNGVDPNINFKGLPYIETGTKDYYIKDPMGNKVLKESYNPGLRLVFKDASALFV